tara:strand:+ start:300 stop:491 length:192 start_codon:yes stop_codon:yes gene_type:complete
MTNFDKLDDYDLKQICKQNAYAKWDFQKQYNCSIGDGQGMKSYDAYWKANDNLNNKYLIKNTT